MSDEEDWGGVNIETFYRVTVGDRVYLKTYRTLGHVRAASQWWPLCNAKAEGFLKVEKVTRTYQETAIPVEL